MWPGKRADPAVCHEPRKQLSADIQPRSPGFDSRQHAGQALTQDAAVLCPPAKCILANYGAAF